MLVVGSVDCFLFGVVSVSISLYKAPQISALELVVENCWLYVLEREKLIGELRTNERKRRTKAEGFYHVLVSKFSTSKRKRNLRQKAFAQQSRNYVSNAPAIASRSAVGFQSSGKRKFSCLILNGPLPSSRATAQRPESTMKAETVPRHPFKS